MDFKPRNRCSILLEFIPSFDAFVLRGFSGRSPTLEEPTGLFLIILVAIKEMK